MDPDSAVRFMLDRSRAAWLALHRVVGELASQGVDAPQVDLVGGVVVRAHGGTVSASERVGLVRLEEHEFELRVGAHSVRVPYGLVREAWRTTNNRVGLMLEARVVIDNLQGGYAMLDVVG